MTALALIKNFIEKIDKTISISFDENFYADIENRIIYVEMKEHLRRDELIQNFVKANFNLILDPFLIGILHEVGHIMTYEPYLSYEREILNDIVGSLYAKEMEEDEKYFNLYFSIPAEIEATKWGINYYINNKDLCEDFLHELYEEE